MDTSASMRKDLPGNRAVSFEYAKSLLRSSTDQAFVMGFGRLWHIDPNWTSSPAALIQGIQRVAVGSESRFAGTALFDNIAHTCRTQFAAIDRANSGNFILLFTDGEDNASFQSIKEAVDACHHTNTAIYAFRSDSGAASTGPANLSQLTHETGGRVFRSSESPPKYPRISAQLKPTCATNIDSSTARTNSSMTAHFTVLSCYHQPASRLSTFAPATTHHPTKSTNAKKPPFQAAFSHLYSQISHL